MVGGLEAKMQVPGIIHSHSMYLTVFLFVLQVGSYHYVTGVDASSSASLAAYLNSLLYTVEETPSWFGWGGASGSGKGKGEWKVKSGCYW
jgi:hypothetical protein